MKLSPRIGALLIVVLITAFSNQSYAQIDIDPSKTYLVIKNDGARYVGSIISQNAREITIVTTELGEIIIPKHEIREIRELSDKEIGRNGKIMVNSVFATQYYFSTNANAITKGENFVIWNLYGPNIQFGVGDKFGVGLTTTWFGSPILGSVKYSFLKGNKVGLAVGTLFGTGSWAEPQFGLAVPYGSLTIGETEKNLSFSVGQGYYFGDGESDQITYFSVAGMNRINDRVSLVLDSFLLTEWVNESTSALIIPAVRLHSGRDKAFQIGFAGVAAEGELFPLPLPFVQWYRAF